MMFDILNRVLETYFSYQCYYRLFKELQGRGMDNTLTFVCMSHDDAGGQITFDKNSDNIDIEWKDVGRGPNFDRVNEALEKLSKGLGGSFVKNPAWTEALGKSVVTVHPLGGCPMGESGQTAVVNHAGQVFEGWFQPQKVAKA